MMPSYLGLIQQGLFFGFLIFLITSLMMWFLFPHLQSTIKHWHPTTRANILLLIITLPVLAAISGVMLALLPSVLQLLGFSSDHCLGHIEGHIHFCLIHRPAPVDNWLVWIPGFVFFLLLVSMVINIARDIRSSLNFQNYLVTYFDSHDEQGFVLLNSHTPLALTCGLFKQTPYISNALLEGLNSDEQSILLAHEKAHIKRKDAFKKLIARSLVLAHLPFVQKKLLSLFNLACEQACDLAAVNDKHQPSRVASLLLKIEKIYSDHLVMPDALASNVISQAENDLPERIHALLHASDFTENAKTVLAILLMVLSMLLIGHDLIHDWLEHIMFLVAGD